MDTISHSDELIFRSKLPDIEISDHLPLHSYCFENLSTNSHRPCLVNSTTGAIHTYAEVDLIARRVAAGLVGLGIRKGHVIMILLPNSPEFVFSFLGASHLGAISSTANPFYTPGEIHKQATAAGARIVITESCHVQKLKNLGIKIIVIDDIVSDHMPFSHLMSTDESTVPTVDIKPDDVVALPYSSGTTGLPKGVMLTHRSLITSVAQQVDGDNPNLFFNNQDVILCVLPLFHIYSLISVLLCGLRAGAAILIMRKFDIGVLVDQVERHQVTVAPLVPPIVMEIAKNSAVVDGRDLSSIRMLISGAASMGRELQEALLAKIPNAKLGQGYGMTEAGALSMCLAFAKEAFGVKSGSCGTVVRNAEMKIVDPKTGVSLPRNLPGEIYIRGNQIMKGYLNDPESTQQTIDKEGWLHTGDVGYVDDDGEIFIVGRLKEIIKYKGFQVAPAELEAMLIAHPNIVDAAVISMEDELAGEVPVAYVVRSNGDEITEDDIKKYIAVQVVFYKRIHKVFFVESIPKSSSGKILRKDLRTKLAAGVPITSQHPYLSGESTCTLRGIWPLCRREFKLYLVSGKKCNYLDWNKNLCFF